MTREQAKQNLIGFGIEEPTSEQITNYLNQIGSETQAYKEKLNATKTDKETIAQLQAQLDEINAQNMTDIEKANADKQKALDTVAELTQKVATMELKNKFAEKGITGETADKLLASLGGGNIDVDVLGQIISDRESAAAIKKEQEIAGQTTNPNGGKQKEVGSEKTEAENLATGIGKSLAEAAKTSNDIVSAYL